MNKTKALIVIAFASIGILSSCSKLSSSPDHIVGTWEMIRHYSLFIDSTVSPITTETIDTDYTHGEGRLIVLKADKTFTLSDTIQQFAMQENTQMEIMYWNL